MNKLFKLTTLLSLVIYTVTATAALPLDKIELPDGFKIDIFATGVPNARAMTLGEKGTLFIGTRHLGKVYAIPKANQPNAKREVLLIADDLKMPVGVAFKDGALYVSATDRILKYDNIENKLNNPPQPIIVSKAFPNETHHGWKFIAFGPDGKLYVPVGAPCNICNEQDKRFATIMRMEPDGSNLEIYAHGVRNSVGFDWHPTTKELWFTDNGRDWLGDDLPPCELNHAPKQGMHFGYPFCHGTSVSDPEFGHLKACSEFTPPKTELGPHVAPLGMRFYTGKAFPEQYHNKIFIAEHGSWNRSTPIGYRVTMVSPDNPEKFEIFAQGWLSGSQRWGRPVDVLVMPDGSMLVSDDLAGVIYRISYVGTA